jgi:hypothetical protein
VTSLITGTNKSAFWGTTSIIHNSTIMNKIKIIASGILILGMLSLSGCFVTKAGNYVSEKSKAAWSGTKSFFGAGEDK